MLEGPGVPRLTLPWRPPGLVLSRAAVRSPAVPGPCCSSARSPCGAAAPAPCDREAGCSGGSQGLTGGGRVSPASARADGWIPCFRHIPEAAWAPGACQVPAPARPRRPLPPPGVIRQELVVENHALGTTGSGGEGGSVQRCVAEGATEAGQGLLPSGLCPRACDSPRRLPLVLPGARGAQTTAVLCRSDRWPRVASVHPGRGWPRGVGRHTRPAPSAVPPAASRGLGTAPRTPLLS